jgi:hypothetical protein
LRWRYLPRVAPTPGRARARRCLSSLQQLQEIQMPIILWLLGVPLTVVLLLMLFHVI